MNLTLTIRLGGERDRQFIRELGLRTVAASASAVRSAPEGLLESSYERLIEFAFDQAPTIFIAETELRRLGFLILLDRIPDEVTGLPQGFIAYMAVEPEARRRGVAKRLLAAAEAEARERGLPHLSMMVTEDNVGARELYAQAGFVSERRLLCKPL